MPPSDSAIHRYHDGTKHHFNRFARALGYLDWASQPKPFRSYPGARIVPLYPSPAAGAGGAPAPVSYDELFADDVAAERLTAAALGDLLRHALGLSAWKQYGQARWSLRVNPSSGNLHPTEAYIVTAAFDGAAGVYHYMADRHALECRCTIDESAWAAATPRGAGFLLALTSIHWREAWKYGERAFRYCQHDLGHAIAAVAVAARMFGWHARILPNWSHKDIGTLTGIDRDEDFLESEREEPGCVMLVSESGAVRFAVDGARLLEAIRVANWSGQASLLSQDHVQWTFIDDIANATRDAGVPSRVDRRVSPIGPGRTALTDGPAQSARALILQRRSAVAFDGISSIGADAFFRMLGRVMPSATVPWDALWWPPRIHLLLFVHRVEGLAPGLYALGRDEVRFSAWLGAMRGPELRERAHDVLPLVRIARGDCRALARRLSCDQDIAADGAFSLGMVADFDASLDAHGPSFYRHLFWESGLIGQMLYLEAEAAGVRGTGIGCFYDDAVHAAIGLEGHAFQSLYHFTVGSAVEDVRLTTAPGYDWER